MQSITRVCLILACFSSLALAADAPTKVTIDSDALVVINGKKMFPISVAVLPPADGKTPEGKSAWQEFADGGVNLARIVPSANGESYGWNDQGYKVARDYLDALAPAHLYSWLWLGDDIAHFTEKENAKADKLKKLIETFKDHPALAFWKGEDEPLWGMMNAKEQGTKSPGQLALPYKMIHQMDPNHPVVVIQAPRGTEKELAAYRPVLDVTGMDVFPISYPPGGHLGEWPNKEISSVGDWTKIMVEAAGGKPVWMTLQVSFSGTTQKGKTLKMPTFPEERFMTYEAIIDGARGLNYFGGANKACLNERDEKLGYNWTFWESILKPLLAEINEKSPLNAALIAPESKIKLKTTRLAQPEKGEGGKKKPDVSAGAASGIEVLTRESPEGIFVLACSREPAHTQEVEFSGLPSSAAAGEVLYESPRKVTAKDGKFTDWFGPYEVHVYKFGR